MAKNTDSAYKFLDQVTMFQRYRSELSEISFGRPGLLKWRNLALDWIDTLKTETDGHLLAVKVLLTEYILKNGLSTSPKDLYDTRLAKPEYSVDKTDLRQVQVNNYICQFLEWVFTRRIRPSLPTDEVQFYKPPIFRRFRVTRKFEADWNRLLASQVRDLSSLDAFFGTLLEKDTKFAQWVSLAKEWFCTVPENKRGISLDALQRFFVSYLLEHKVVEKPQQFFLLKTSDKLPLISSVFRFSSTGDQDCFVQLNAFLDWALISCRLSQETHGNPFSSGRLGVRTRTRISDDKDLLYLTKFDPLMEDWRRLAAEWLSRSPKQYSHRIWSLSFFFRRYILPLKLDRNPIAFLSSHAANPPFLEVYLASKTRSKKKGGEALTDNDVRTNNIVHDFLQWVLEEKLSEEDDFGRQTVPAELKNPVEHQQLGYNSKLAESNKSPLPIRYIVELRKMLAEGPTFSDWKWAQGASSGAWFDVSPETIDDEDPNCVFRVTDDDRVQLWSPVRSVALYVKLELPLRTFQVRMLDSGEADTWRYENGKFVENPSPLTIGTPQRPYKKGVFYKSNEAGCGDEIGLFINTNKTADIDKPEDKKGYVIPWTHAPALYWLEALRNWQEKYNPIMLPTPWTELNVDHLGHAKHEVTLLQQGTACFLFRDASAFRMENRKKPLPDSHLDQLWHKLLTRLEAEGGHKLPDGTPARFASREPNSKATFFPLHALRVSLITYFVLDAGLPIQVVSKLIAGHSRILMTLYYTKAGISYVNEVLAEAERKAFEKAAESERHFLRDRTYENVASRYAYLSEDAPSAYVSQQSAASTIFEDKGICPVAGQFCDVGGPPATASKVKTRYLPVPGYPKRNCVRCRFFLTGPAFLPGLVAHFNKLSYEVNNASERYAKLDATVRELENERFSYQHKDEYFPKTGELERVQQRYEAEAEQLNQLVMDMQHCHRLVTKSVELGSAENVDSKLQLATNGTIADLGFALKETQSEMLQIEVVCENAIFYPEIDARQAILRRSHLLDLMFDLNGKAPIFYKLNEEQQHIAGNAVMKLIKARAGSLDTAVEFVEGRRQLAELGLITDDFDSVLQGVSSKQALKALTYDFEADTISDSAGEFADAS